MSEETDPLGELGTSSTNDNEKLVGKLGPLHSEYACEVNGISGTLYAGKLGLVFIGVFFFFDKKIFVLWQDVRQIQNLDQGIQVLSKDDSVTVFSGIQPRDKVWTVLVSLHNDSLFDLPSGSTPCNPPQRRRKSDPLLSPRIGAGRAPPLEDEDADGSNDVLLSLSAEGAALPQDPPQDTATNGEEVAKQARLDGLSSQNAALSSELQEVEHTIGKIRLQPLHCVHSQVDGRLYAGTTGLLFYGRRFFFDTQILCVRYSTIKQIRVLDTDTSSGIGISLQGGEMHKFFQIDSPDQVWSSLARFQQESLTLPTAAAQARRGSRLQRTFSDPALQPHSSINERIDEEVEATDNGDCDASTSKEAWKKARSKPAYASVVVKDYRIDNCSLDKFWDLFLGDEAKFSFAKFLESRGDSDVVVTNWSSPKDGARKREVNYMHPVNAPMAPPIAAAFKEQSSSVYSNFGILLETKTFVRDVPMTDCFHVVDRMIVEQGQENCVLIELQFELSFVKSTMFKGIITKTTTKECTRLFEDLSIFLRSCLDGDKKHRGDNVEASKSPPLKEEICSHTESESTRPPYLGLVWVLCTMVIAIQIWVLIEIRSVKHSITEILNVQLHDTRAPIGVVLEDSI